MRKLCAFLALAPLLVFAAGALAPARADENLLTNTAFEAPNAQNVPKGWQLVKYNKEGAEPGEVTLELAEVPPPPESSVAKAQDAPKTIPALEYSIDASLNWAYIGQRSAETQIPAAKAYRFTVWLKSDKAAKVSVILSLLGKTPEGGGKLPEQTKWTSQDLTSDWKLCTAQITVDDSGPYLFFWPRVQLYTPDATVALTLPTLEEVKE